MYQNRESQPKSAFISGKKNASTIENEKLLLYPKVQEWEQLMWTYQQAVPGAKKGEKWVLMDRIFKL
jgi:hypothetical protein